MWQRIRRMGCPASGEGTVGGVIGAVWLLFMATATTAGAAVQGPGLHLYGGDGTALGDAPQLRTGVSIRVSGLLARVRVRQAFRNPGEQWVEGVYVFPLPEDAAVDRLQMRYAERVIEGEIQEKAQARATYERARASGQGASLLDQQRANIFTTAVANIPPRDGVEVVIEYQQSLTWLDGGFSLRFPTVVAPRYIPGVPLDRQAERGARHGWSPATDQVADAPAITPPVVDADGTAFNPLTIAVDLDVGLALASIDSPSHPVRVHEGAAGRYRVELDAGETAADRDFVLHWRPQLADEPSAALFHETWRGQHYSLLMVMPPRPAARRVPLARELILVVDTSGSMHGASIAQARAALLDALDQLRPGDRFNVIQFNSTAASLFAESVPATTDNLARARRHVRGLQAEGGTEMLPALRLALRGARHAGLLRQVIFMTDGAVGNEQALFAAIADDLGDSRLFPVGIGSAPNALFMRHAAAYGRGSFSYIGSVDEVGETIGALFERLSRPALADLQLHWEDADGEPIRPGEAVQAPSRLPDLYAGEPLVVALRSDRAPQRVRLAGRRGAQDWRREVELRGGAASSGVHVLWARRLIEQRLGERVLGAPVDVVRQEVVDLALHHHLVSRYTSLVAVDRTPRRPADRAVHSRAVPAQLPAGWSAQAVFGRLPATATAAPLYLLLGLALLLLAALLRRGTRRA